MTPKWKILSKMENLRKKYPSAFSGYDRKNTKMKVIMPYATQSSWREQQKEEAKSLRPGMQKDFEGMRQEEEATKCREVKKLKNISCCFYLFL